MKNRRNYVPIENSDNGFAIKTLKRTNQMKSCFSVLVFGLIVILKSTGTYAQNALAKQFVSSLTKSVEPMNPMAAFKNVHIKAVRDFKTTYPEVNNESWYIFPDGYRARFISDSAINLITYNKRGKWLNSISKYDESKLNRDVKELVKSVYYDYKIILVEEIEQPNKPVIWLVHLEDNVSLKNIMVSDQEIQLVLDIVKL
jgi:hypothetical protein